MLGRSRLLSLIIHINGWNCCCYYYYYYCLHQTDKCEVSYQHPNQTYRHTLAQRHTHTHTLTHANRLMHNHAQTPPARTHAHHLKCFEGLSSTVLYFISEAHRDGLVYEMCAINKVDLTIYNNLFTN